MRKRRNKVARYYYTVFITEVIDGHNNIYTGVTRVRKVSFDPLQEAEGQELLHGRKGYISFYKEVDISVFNRAVNTRRKK